MSWNTGILNSRPGTIHGEYVTVTNPTGLHFDPHLTRTWLGISRSTIWKPSPGFAICATFIVAIAIAVAIYPPVCCR